MTPVFTKPWGRGDERDNRPAGTADVPSAEAGSGAGRLVAKKYEIMVTLGLARMIHEPSAARADTRRTFMIMRAWAALLTVREFLPLINRACHTSPSFIDRTGRYRRQDSVGLG